MVFLSNLIVSIKGDFGYALVRQSLDMRILKHAKPKDIGLMIGQTTFHNTYIVLKAKNVVQSI